MPEPSSAADSASVAINLPELYQSIARKVKDGSCVLFLGPGAIMAKTDKGEYAPISTLCAQYLLDKYKVKLPESNNNLSFVTSFLRERGLSTDNLLQENVAEYYESISQKCELHPMLAQLTDLRFRMIINTTPDNFVTRLYDEVAQPYFAEFYNFFKGSSNFDFNFEKDQRVVIYNLFGLYQKSESLVLTYKHQLSYIKKIVGEQQNERLPDALTNAFKDYRHHLFLGFDFDDWMLRLLLDTLYKNVRENVQAFAYPSIKEKPAEEDDLVFFRGEFGMKFPGVDMETFATQLVEYYGRLDQPQGYVTGAPPKAKVLVLYNDSFDSDGYERLMKHLRILPAQFVTQADALGQGDISAWLTQTLDSCQVILPLLSSGFYDPQNPAAALLSEIARRNNPRKGTLVMPILLKDVTLDGPLGEMPTLRPTDRQPFMGSGKEDKYAAEIAESLKKYIENLART